MVMVDVPQVTVSPCAPASGATVSPVTEVVAVLVQPFDPVTVTVYVPAVEAVGFWSAEVNPGPPHEKVFPAVPGPPFRVTVGVGQVIVPVAEAVAPGGVLFRATEVVAVEVQPLTLLVTVTV